MNQLKFKPNKNGCKFFANLIITFCFLLLNPFSLISQYECGTDQIHQHSMANDPEYKKNVEKTEAEIFKLIQNRETNGLRSDEVYTIPVVVHVIHLGEPVGTGTNISDQKIFDAIEGLNDRWKNVIGDGVDMGFEFCLASRNPDNQPTIGINRINGNGINRYSTSGISFSGSCGASSTAIKDLSIWPSSDYYNIWVVSKICPSSVGGYADFPSFSKYNGTVIHHGAMDYTLNATPIENYVQSTLAHEIGHAFNLYHTFEGSEVQGTSFEVCPKNNECLLEGDKVCDTPPHRKSDCVNNVCSNSVEWQNSNSNYMSYCIESKRFTHGQKNRARAVAMVSPRVQLLSSLGCVAPIENDAAVSKIKFPLKTTHIYGCEKLDSLAAIVIIKNYGMKNLTSLRILSSISEDSIYSYNWNGVLLPNREIEVTLPKVRIPNDGNYVFKAYSTLPNGQIGGQLSNDTKTSSFQVVYNNPLNISYKQVAESCNGLKDGSLELVSINRKVTILEDFEGETDWTIVNGEDPNKWVIGNGTSSRGEKSIYISNDGNSNAFDINKASIVHIYKDFYFPPNAKNIKFNFDWKNANNLFGNFIYDFLSLNILPFDKSGIEVLNSMRVPGNNQLYFYNKSSFSNFTVSGIDSLAGKFKRIVFTWENDSFTGLQPPGAIDNIEISYDLPDTGPYSFEWSGAIISSKQNLINLPSGNYSVVVTDTLGCKNEKNVKINTPPVLQITSEVKHNLCYGDAEGSINVTPINGMSPYIYNWSNGSMDNKITNLLSDFYYLTISDRSNIIEQFPKAASCIPNSTTPGFNIGIYNVNLNSINHNSSSAQNESYRNFTHIKTYIDQDNESYLTIQTGPNYEERVLAWIDFNNNGIFEDSELIMNSLNSLPNRIHRNRFSIPEFTTKQTPLRLRIGSDISDITSSLGTFKGPCNNSKFGQIEDYTIIIGYPACSSFAFEVNEPLPMEAKISKDSSRILCEGDSINLTVTEGYSYLWSTLDTTQTITLHKSGDYFVMVRDSNGCAAFSDTISVLFNELPDATIMKDGNQSFCIGDSITLSCTESTSYLWNSGETSKDIIVKNSGNYRVTVADSFGCSSTSDIIQIVVNSLPHVEITPSAEIIFCRGDSVTLNSSSAERYIWSNEDTSQNITVYNTGSYSLKISDSNNCEAESLPINVVVNELPIPIISSNGPTNFCQGDSITLMSSDAISYLWNTLDTNGDIIVSESGNYFVVVTDEHGCQGQSIPISVVETDNPIANVALSRSPIMCQGDSIILSADNAEAYLWSNGSTTKSVILKKEGEYSVTVTNSEGCISVSQPITLIVNPLPLSEIDVIGDTSICKGEMVNLSASNATNYNWSNGDTAQNINVIASGNYFVSITDSNGCSSASSPVKIIVHPLPVALILPEGPTSFCKGESVILSTNSSESYLWSSGATTQTVEVSSSGNYSVIVADENGCTGFTSLSVTVHPLPSAEILLSGPTIFCEGDSVTITAAFGANYHWNTGQTSQSIKVFEEGEYIVKVTDENGCSAVSAPTKIIINPLPIAEIVPNGPISFCQDTSIILTAVDAKSYLWSNGAKTQNVDVSSSGNYGVTVTDENGCTDFTSITVTVNPLPSAEILLSGPATFCEGDSVTITAAFGANYQWNTGESSQSISVFEERDYIVKVTDENGCSAVSEPINVIVNPLPSAKIIPDGPTTFCQGENVNLLANEAQSYLWNTGDTTQSIDVISQGVYIVKITDDKGCSAISSETLVEVNPVLTPSIVISSSSNVACDGDSITFLSTSSNTGDFPTYKWFVNGVVQSEIGSIFSTTTLTNNDQILCRMSSSLECLSQTTAQSNTISIAVNPLLTPEVSITTPSTSILSCQNVTFNAVPVNGGISPTYKWFLNGALVSASPTFTSSDLINGDDISCIMTSTATCKSSLTAMSNIISMSVSPLTQPSILVSGDTISSSNYAGSLYTYSWYFNGIEISTSPFITCNQNGSGTYYLVVNYNGCTVSSNSLDIVCTVSSKDYDDQNYFNVYPNPTNNILNIYNGNIASDEYTVLVYNLLGQELEVKRLSDLSDRFITQLDMGSYINGIYTIVIYSDKHRQFFKVYKVE